MMKFFQIACLFSSVFALLVALVHPVVAQSDYEIVKFDKASRPLILPIGLDRNLSNHDYYSKTFSEPQEPIYTKIKFAAQGAPKHLQERIERLLYGITIDISPEYDYYGYEIRRYMRSILTPSDLQNKESVLEAKSNVRRARIVLNYWQEELNKEMKALEKALEEGQPTSHMLSSFRYNRNEVTRFIPTAYGWIDRNSDFLDFLESIEGQYFVKYPLYQIPNNVLKAKFSTLYAAREEARERMTRYSPFRAMIY